MELKKFVSKTIGSGVIIPDGKTRFNFNGKDTVCTKATMSDGVVTAYFTTVAIKPNTNGETIGIFDVNSQVKELEDMVVSVNDVTVFEAVEETPAPTPAEP